MTDAMYGGPDPRERGDGLGQLLRALFPDPRVWLDVARAPRSRPPRGWKLVAAYALVPNASTPRFLVPLGDRRVASASLFAYLSLRSWKVRASRAALGATARAGVMRWWPSQLRILVPDDIASSDVVLTEYLAEALGVDTLYASCGVLPVTSNYKPTLQLFDRRATPIGFAKVGWNASTRALVRTEALALRAMPASASDHPLVPGLKTTLEWGDRTVTVVEPLPRPLRQVPEDVRPVKEMLAVARRDDGPSALECLDGSIFARRLAEEAGGPDVQAAVGGRFSELVAGYVERFGSVELEFAHWHGDWVPWNLATHRGRLVAWDWEHSSGDMPLGTDLVHNAFQRELVLRELPVAEAARIARSSLAESRGLIGLDDRQCDAVVLGYLLEIWLRTCRRASGGGGWNEMVHPGVLDVIDGLLTG